MKITKVTINEVKKCEPLKAFASVEFDEEFVVGSIRIIDGKKGLFVTMPQQKGKDNEYHDICFPITKKMRATITEKVLEEYDK